MLWNGLDLTDSGYGQLWTLVNAVLNLRDP
jgi:hypothetical protein